MSWTQTFFIMMAIYQVNNKTDNANMCAYLAIAAAIIQAVFR